MDFKKTFDKLSTRNGTIGVLIIFNLLIITVLFLLLLPEGRFNNLPEKSDVLYPIGLGFVGAVAIYYWLPKITNYIEEGKKGAIKATDWKATNLSKITHDVQTLTTSIKDLTSELNEPKHENIKELDEDEKKLNIIIEHTQSIRNALSIQIDKISRSGNVNLTIGLSLTVIAIVMLILVVYADDAPAYLFDETTNSGMRFFIHMIPRLSIVLFIEIFSFFFLNLYKKNVDEIKYFNNERTNIESKIIALKMAVVFGEKSIISETIESLHKTDRNAIIKKGETTLEIEKIKFENNGKGEIMDKILSLTKIIKAKE